jgi:hypothetical protein
VPFELELTGNTHPPDFLKLVEFQFCMSWYDVWL